LLFFQRWRLPRGLTALGVAAILAHPASFFLVAGYSEALFLMSVLGFLYWAEQPHRGAGAIAAVHGVVMTATRIVGVPLVAVPLLHACLTGGRRLELRRLVRPLLLGAVALLGCGLFFAFCQWRFGHWDLYTRANAVGWGVHPHYLALFSERIF